MSYSFVNPSEEIIKGYLEKAKTIAVVGLSNRQYTASYMVASFLQSVGFQIVPVNPKLVGQELLGETVYGSLQEIPFSVDIVDIFRRSEYLPEVAKDFLSTDAKVFWAQLGLENQEAEELLVGAGRESIVMNRCIKIEYMKLFD